MLFSWVRVEDQLPTKELVNAGERESISRTLLVVVTTKNGLQWTSIDWWDFYESCWMDHEEEKGEIITHWATMPPPPKVHNGDAQSNT
jgi:hypothetical protein